MRTESVCATEAVCGNSGLAGGTGTGARQSAGEARGQLVALLTGHAAERGARGAVRRAETASSSRVDIVSRKALQAEVEIVVGANSAAGLARIAASIVEHPPVHADSTHRSISNN